MPTYVQLEPPPPSDWNPPTRQVTNKYTANTPTLPWSIDVTHAVTQPDVGWTTPDNGTTWVQPAPDNAAANRSQVLQKIAGGVAVNQTFLTASQSVVIPLTSPEQQTLVNQVVALTRQMIGIAKIITNNLSDTSGT